MPFSPKTICARCGKPIGKQDVWIMADGKPQHFTCRGGRKINPHNPNSLEALTQQESEELWEAQEKPPFIH